ncbi:MAG: VacJ family lipoprotein, partial [Deltaproteobacteria bacterium]|nr:VacJ family lipoprotein [Deltaproteobacteria bacterium]
MGYVVEGKQFMGFCKRLWFVLVFGLICWGIQGHRDITLAAPFASGESAVSLQLSMAGHELVQTARLDEDVAKASAENPSEKPEDSEAWPEDELSEEPFIPDPLEPMNRAFFAFNDAAYFWFFKPVGEGYSAVMPEVLRVSIRNFFTNLSMPIRLVSSLLQGKIESVGMILVRFVVNSSAGFLGFQDVAKQALDYPVQDEDLGQVFAFYGVGPGFYLNLPFLGAGSLRDSVGWVGGLYLNPLDFIVEEFWVNTGARAFDMTNKTSLRIGEYEALKDA